VRSDAERLVDILEAAGKIAAKVVDGRAAFDKDEYVQLARPRASGPDYWRGRGIVGRRY